MTGILSFTALIVGLGGTIYLTYREVRKLFGGGW